MKYEINTVAQFKAALFDDLGKHFRANDPICRDFKLFDQYVDDYAAATDDIRSTSSTPATRTRKAWFAELNA